MALTHSTPLVDSACKALGTIFRSGTLPLPTGGGRGSKETHLPAEAGEGVVTKAMLVQCLANTIRNSKQVKVSYPALFPDLVPNLVDIVV